MARFWQTTDGRVRQPEHGTPEWSEHLRNHLERMKHSYGSLSSVEIEPHDVKEHTLPHDDVKTQFYRRLLLDGQKTLPIVVEERPEGGYRLVDGIHRLGAHQTLNKPIQALLVTHTLEKMAIKDIRMGRRIPVAPGHFLGYTRFDYSHVLPSTMTSQGYRLNVYHDPSSEPNEERFVTAVLTHPKAQTTSQNFPHSVGSVSGHLQPNGIFHIGTAQIDEAHRGGKGLPMYEALLAHSSRKLGAHTVAGGWHSTMAHKVHQKLALKHGMDYNAQPNPAMKTPENSETGPFDGKFDSYSYAIKTEEMAKAIAPFIASMMLAASPAKTPDASEQPKHEIAQTMYKPWTSEGLHEDLHPIAHLESSWGKNIAHATHSKGEFHTAFGAVGMKPVTAHEEYMRSKKAQKDFPGFADQNTFLNEFRGNPQFYNRMASEHFARLKRLHGSPEKAAYAWRWGSTAAANAAPEQIESDPYVQKYKALKSVKKLGKSQRDKETVRVVSVAAYRDGLMLFGLRGDKKKWCLPGGHMEPAEDTLEAARRELKEETGLVGGNWEKLGQGEVPDKDITVYCYKCEVDEEPDASNDPDAEFIEFQWVNPEAIPDEIKENLYNKNDINLELQGLDYKVSDLDKSVLDPNAGYTITHEVEDVPARNSIRGPVPAKKYVKVLAHHGGQVVGALHLNGIQEGAPDISSFSTEVDPAHRRKGLASAMYAHAEKVTGLKMKPSSTQSHEGRMLWDGNENYPQFGKSEGLAKAAKKPKFGPDDKNLVVQHNLSAGGLEHADKLGGLPAPSIAIAHKSHPLTGFGEISLVGHHSLVDPAQHPVYDADIYSPRQPRAEHKYNEKKMVKLQGELRPHFKAIGSDWVSSLGDEFKRYGPGMTRAGSYNIAEGLKHAYLKDKGVEIPEIQRDKPIAAPWVKEPAMEAFFKEHGKDQNYGHDSDYSKKLGEAARASIESWSKNIEGLDPEEQEYMKDLAHKEYINPDTGEVWFGKSPKLFQNHSDFGQKEPDPYKMRDWVNNKVKEMGEDDFHDWSEKKLQHLHEGQYIPKYSSYSGNMRRVPYTIDNILKEMKGNPRQGENFNYGLGSIRAGGAKKFRDLEQMRQHQGQIVSHDDFEKIRDHMSKRWEELNEELAPYHGSKMNSMSALGEAVSESYKRGKYLGSQLKLSGFEHVPPEVQRRVNEFAQDLVRMPTEYFEAKPQRVVGLHEFKGAAVPKNVHPRTIERLKSNGIQHIEHYDPDVQGDRARAINAIAEAQKLHLSEDEFYGETLLKDLDWHLEKAHDLSRYGYKFNVSHLKDREGNVHTTVVRATHPDEYARSGDDYVGSVDFSHMPDGSLVADRVEVRPNHQRRGVARTMYRLAQEHTGKDIAPSPQQTQAGSMFWLGKARPGPRLPKLGIPDDRRETDQVVTPRQLKIKQLAQANAFMNDQAGYSQDMWNKYPGTKEAARADAKRALVRGPSGALGAAPGSTKTKASYALASPWLAGPQYSQQTPAAIQLHENNHMMFGRVHEKHGQQARRNLAQNMWHHAEKSVTPEEAGLVNKYLDVRYPKQYRGYDHEERIGTLLNLVNDKGERNMIAMDPKYAHITQKVFPSGRVGNDMTPLIDAAKKMHRALQDAGQVADEKWIGYHGDFLPHYNEKKDEIFKKSHIDWFLDDSPAMRILALKTATPHPQVLDDALNDEHPDVRVFAAQHPALSFEMLFNVLSHKDIDTRKAALKNPNITDEHLEFAQHDPDIAWEVANHPLRQKSLAKNIGFVEFPKLGVGVHTYPMPMNVADAKDRKTLMGDVNPKVSGGKMFFNINSNPDKRLPPRQRKTSGYVIPTGDPNQFKGRMDHEAQHSVFINLHQRHGTHAYHAALNHVLGALSNTEKNFLNVLNPQLKDYPQSQRGEEAIAYMQNFLQDPVRRKKWLADFAPNGKRLTEVGQRKAHQMVKDMWKRMRNRAHEFGPEHIEEYKANVRKNDAQMLEKLPQLLKEANLIGYNVIEDMAGNSLIDQKVLKAVEFLSGKKCDMTKFRRAFWKEEDQYKAALVAVDLEPTDENVQSLKNIADLQDVKKNNIDDTIKDVKAVFPDDKNIADAIQRGVDHREVKAPELEGKHVGGIRTVTDPQSREVFLMKPGSGAPSPARGVRQQVASPSEREACFYAVAKLLGLGDRMVETYLLNVDGKFVAAMRMLPHNWTNLEKLKFQNKTLPGSVLEKYRVTGELHTWAILDYILGNPDRHGQNLMVGPAEDNYPVVLIDHGSALAGPNFDPANDEDSFIPYYFRAWKQKSFKNSDDPSNKMKLMPKTSDAGRKHIEEFIMKLNPSEIEGVLVKYGVDPTAIIGRIEKVKHLLTNGLPLDEGVNKLWILGA